MTAEDVYTRLNELGLELAFGCEEAVSDTSADRFEVFDAECLTVAHCPTAELAELVRDALNHYATKSHD